MAKAFGIVNFAGNHIDKIILKSKEKKGEG